MAVGVLAMLGCGPQRAGKGTTPGGDGGAAASPSERAAIIAASDLPDTIAKPLPGDPMQVTVHRLSNGMTVYVSVDREKPRYLGWIGVRAGSRHDPADSTGLAHYLEHMLFKGTDEFGTLDPAAEAPHVERVRALYAELREVGDDAAKRARIFGEIDRETQAIATTAIPNELDRLYATMGVEGVNAFTSDEQTVYIGDVPSNRMEAWAALEIERFSDPVFRLFYPELEAVYEEKNLSLDDPDNRVWETMMKGLLPQHPYGAQTTIGESAHLKSPAYQDMVDYFERWYVPNNMAIVLAGDVDAKTALPLLERSFGQLEPKAVPTDLPGKVVPLSGRIAREVVAEGEEAVQIAWLTVPVSHADEPVIAVMDRLLDDEKVGLMNTQLELTQKLPEASSFSQSLREAGYFGVRGLARGGQSPAEVEQLLVGVIEKLRRGEFSEADIEAAKLHHSVDRKLRLEFTSARANEMMDAFVTHQQWDDVVARDARFAAVTKADVVRVANAYLGDDRVVVVRREGKPEVAKIDKPKITPVKIDPSRKSAFGKRIEAMPAAQLEPQWAVEGRDYAHRKLPAGDLIASRNVRNDLFTLEYRFDRGYRKEPLLCYALDLLELSGAKDRSAEQFQKQVYALGASVSTWCDAEHSSVSISGPDDKLEPVLALMDEWLAAPSFDGKTLSSLRDNTLSTRMDGMAEDRQLSSALDSFAKYERRSAWLRRPSNRALQRAQPNTLRKLISSFMDHRHRTLYFGPREADLVAKVVPRGKRHREVGEVEVKSYRRTAGPRVFFLHKEGAKANVRFVLPQGPLPRELRPNAELYSEYLSGSMSALVFQEIRESRGLAYSAYSVYDPGDRPRDASGLLGFMSTQADKTPVAVETFLELLRAPGVQGDRLAVAKASIDQRYRASRLEPRWINYWVIAWDDLGEPTDPRPAQWKRMAELGEVDLEAFAKRFADTDVIVAIVGDRSRVDLGALRKVAEVQEVKVEDLFSYGPFPAAPAEARPPAGASAPAPA
ncbi:MAG: insulinase family protein, partial [Deltaproteobacteria bacterium]|nr:insulinase family protein [Nannocystaceae bacterium]